MTDKVKRRLTTVLCADVHGYSRLMEADEAGTLETLRRYRTAMTGLVERHDGRIVNTWGDAVIAEFASVVEAVQCAVEIQQEISNQEPDPTHAPMRFRIGINLGDVMVDGSDIYGDGVNIAARLQQLAEPGGVVVSGSVYDQVYNKLSLGFDCLGTWLDPPHYAIVARDQHRIHFRCAEPPAPNPDKYADELLDAYLFIEDADALYVEFAARGVEFTRGLANAPWHSREFVVKDCDGRLLAFGASPE